MKYNLVCGFETHIELSTKEKLFCPCKVKFGSEPNSNCCPICIGAPGTLPALNREAVIYAIKINGDFPSIFMFSEGLITSLCNSSFTSRINVYFENSNYYIASKTSTAYSVSIKQIV